MQASVQTPYHTCSYDYDRRESGASGIIQCECNRGCLQQRLNGIRHARRTGLHWQTSDNVLRDGLRDKLCCIYP